MAIFEKTVTDGIQLGNNDDFCFKCHKIGSVIPKEDSLEYIETFKLNINGLSYCLCLDHLQELLGDYVLVHKDDFNKEENNKDSLNEENEDNIKDDKEEKKKDTKKKGKK